MLERVRSVADPTAAVEAFGSSIYAPARADDVDVLVTDDDPARLATALGSRYARRCRRGSTGYSRVRVSTSRS